MYVIIVKVIRIFMHQLEFDDVSIIYDTYFEPNDTCSCLRLSCFAVIYDSHITSANR
jgi:hypothetical protein